MRLILAALLVFSASGCLVAEEHPELEAWMKTMDTGAKALNKLQNKTGDEAIKNAESIGGAYESMIGFWRQRNAADAVNWSEQGKAAAVQLASAASAEDAQQAAAAFKSLGGTCRSCHDAYREKLPNGKYALKQGGSRSAQPRDGAKQ
jgi:cytochrome c556